MASLKPATAASGEPAALPAQAAWTLTEAANEPFFALVQRFVFASYFANQLFADPEVGAGAWGLALAIAGVAIGVLAPVCGAFADASGPRKPWIAFMGLVSALACAGLWFAAPGAPAIPVVIAVAVATLMVELLVVFTNAALPTIASSRRVGLLSGLCFGFGQIAGILALLAVLALSEAPETGLLAEPHAVDRLAGPIAAVALVLFLLPFLAIAPDEPSRAVAGRLVAAREGLATLWRTLKEALANKSMRAFIIGRAIGADGMSIVFAFGGILATSLFGWDAGRIAQFGLIVTVFAAAGGFLGGWIDARIGSRPTIVIGFLLVAVGTFGVIGAGPERIAFVPMDAAPGPLGYSWPEFGYLASAIIVAVGSGPAIASMRALMAKIAPLDRTTAYFGVYSLVGKATFFLGPAAYAGATAVLGDSQLALSVAFLFLAVGVVAFLAVKEERIA